MSTFSKLAVLLFFSVSFLGYAQSARAISKDLQKLIGVYESDGYKFVVRQSANSLILKTNAELTKDAECSTKIGPPTGYDEDPGYAEAYYQLNRGNCPSIDGHVTLHYNQAITGVDVYLIDVLIYRNSGPRPGNGRTVRWSLTKVSGN